MTASTTAVRASSALSFDHLNRWILERVDGRRLAAFNGLSRRREQIPSHTSIDDRIAHRQTTPWALSAPATSAKLRRQSRVFHLKSRICSSVALIGSSSTVSLCILPVKRKGTW